jgi:hypothetical protein
MILGRETRSAVTSSTVDNDLAATTIAMCGGASWGRKYFCHRCYANQGLPAAHVPFLAVRFWGTEAWDRNLERAQEVPD